MTRFTTSPWRTLKRVSRVMQRMEHGPQLLPSSKTETLVRILGFLLGSVPRTASSTALRQGLSDAIDSGLSGVWLPDEDYTADHEMAALDEHGLHVCPACGSTLVQPVRWERSAIPQHWHIWRRCPECQWHADGVHPQRNADAFRKALQCGTDMVAARLDEQERHGLADILEPFANALAADLITADDFHRRQ